MQQGLLKIVGISIVMAVMASGVMGASFVSFNGKFAITYPDSWEKIDYRTVDYYLQQSQASREVYNYEGVFAPAQSVPFYSGEYMILTVDTVGNLTGKQIDSVKELLATTFGKGIKYAPQGNFLTNLESDEPTYDASNQTLSVLSTVKDGQKSIKQNLMVMKFYDRGIANFFFYSPDSLMARSIPEFKNIVSSFSTDLQSALPKEEVKVTKAEPEKKKVASRWVPYSGLAIILIIIAAAARRRRNRAKKTGEN